MPGELGERLRDLRARAGLSGVPIPVLCGVLVACVAALALAFARMSGDGPSVSQPAEGTPPPGVSAAIATSTVRASAESSSTTVMVHVVGAVRRAGVYTLPKGSRAADAVRSAGGATPEADESAINEARVLTDGEQLCVPVKGAAQPAGAGPPSTVGSGAAPGGSGGSAGGAPKPAAGGPVDINHASAEELDTLPGVGPSTAAKIVADREKNGPFRSVEDLSRIPGIGAKKVEALKDVATAG